MGVSLVALLALAYAALAGVHHGTRSLLHLGLGALLVSLSLLPVRALRDSGALLPSAKAGAALLLAVASGLVALPMALLSWLSPTLAGLRPDNRFFTLSLDPEATVGELCDLLLPIGTLAASVAFAAAWGRRSGFERAMRVSLLVVMAVGALHALSGATELFGIVETSLTPAKGAERTRFFAPFINPNHFGSALVLLLPVTLQGAIEQGLGRSERLLWATAAIVALAMLVLLGSSGALVAGGVALLLWLWRCSPLSRGALAGATLLGALLLLPWFLWLDPRTGTTLSDRVEIWQIGLSTLPGAWLAGSGGGNFGIAVQPYVTTFTGWAHAHDDIVEWLVETGLIGAIAAPFAVFQLWPGKSRWGTRADALVIGIIGVIVHALVDFPLQIPALAMACAAVLGFRLAAYGERAPMDPIKARAILIPLAALQCLAAAYEARTMVVLDAVETVRTEKMGALGARTALERFAPWRAEIDLLNAWEAERRHANEEAVAHVKSAVASHPDDPYILRAAARVLARAGDAGGARALYDRSVARFPGDYRTRVARAMDSPKETKADAWKDALLAGAPIRYLPEAYNSLPVGLVWLQVGESREPRFAASLGGLLARAGDHETAVLAYELAAMRSRELHLDERPQAGHVRSLMALGRTEEAELLLASALAIRPEDMGLQMQHAEILQLRGQHADAADIWLRLSERDPRLLAHALRATEAADGPNAAIDLADKRALLGQRRTPDVVLELARLQREIGKNSQCVAILRDSDLLGDPRLGSRARQLLGSCE